MAHEAEVEIVGAQNQGKSRQDAQDKMPPLRERIQEDDLCEKQLQTVRNVAQHLHRHNSFARCVPLR